MKANPLVLLFLFLMLGVAAAQQTNSASSVTNSDTFAELKAKAEKGDAIAQCKFGWAYWFGKGVTMDDTEAVKWWHKAAEQNNAEAQNCLGTCYSFGDGVAQNYSEAIKWIRRAADQGNVTAQYNLGQCYYEAHGVAKDMAEAVKWYLKSAEQNFAQAQYNLGICYRDGLGVPKDEEQEVNWFRKAAEQNHSGAQNDLAACYTIGEGVPIDYVEAYKWDNLASAQGNADAKKWLAIIEQRMTPEQIAEAQRRSAAFVPKSENPNSNSDNFINPTASGTGFFITDDGYLISNFHVVKGATRVRLLTSAGLIDTRVVQTDAADDLALLKADGRFTSLPIITSRNAGLGDTVFTLGFPDPGLQGFAPKLAKGEIASLSGAGDDARYFQVSVPVQPGNSGGALVDGRGNVIGIVSAKLDAAAALAASGALPEDVNYAVKSSFLLSFLESVPDVDAKLKAVNTADEKFSEAVKSVEKSTVLVLVY